MLTEEEIRKHFQHKCNTGYDPLLCVHLIYYPTFLDRNTKTGQMSIRKDIDNIKGYNHQYIFVDRVITEDKYVELITKTKTNSIGELADVDKLNMTECGIPTNGADEEEAGIFWLKPTSKCKTLQDLFTVYQAKIKILFGTK
jgi:hypothetical protein